MHKRLLLTAVLVAAFATGCDESTPPGPAVATSPTVTTITPPTQGVSAPTGKPSVVGHSAPAVQKSGLPVGVAPIPGTTVESITRAWAQHWHVTPTPYARLGAHSTRLTVDFPAAHGQLYMTVGRQSADATAANLIYCEVTDKSLGPNGFVKMNRKTAEQLVIGCPGPALTPEETKQVVDFVARYDKPDASATCGAPGGGGQCRWSDNRVDLARFQLVAQTAATQFRLYVLGRKGAV